MKKIIILAMAFLGMATAWGGVERNSGDLQLFLYGQYGFNFHTTEYDSLPGVESCCPGYSEASGWGLSGGLGMSYYLSDELSLGLRTGLRDLSALFERVEADNSAQIILDGVPTQGEFTHYIDVGLPALEIMPMLGYEIADGFNLGLGTSFNIPLSPTFDQREEITKPANRGTFVENGVDTKSRTRAEASGDLPNAAGMLISAEFGAWYEFPMNEDNSLTLVPELFAGYVFTAPVEGYDWTIFNLRGGVSLRYTMDLGGEEGGVELWDGRDTIVERDTVLVEVEREARAPYMQSRSLAEETEEDIRLGSPVVINEQWVKEVTVPAIADNKSTGESKADLDLGIKAIGLDSKGEEKEVVEMKLVEYISSEIRPLLPFVFFDEASAVLKTEYTGNSESVENIYAPQVYYKILDTVAARALNQNMTISLLGSYVEGESESLARERAESVKSYLTSLGMNSEKIDIQTEKQEYREDTEAELRRAEGRRVEIVSQGGKATDVVVLNDTVVESNPPTLKLIPSSNVEIIGNWSVVVSQDGQVLRSFEGVGELPRSLVWNVEREGSKIYGSEGSLNIEFKAEQKGKSRSATTLIPFKQTLLQEKQETQQDGFIIGRYELILFDFGSSELSSEHKAIIERVKDELSSKSRLIIEGYTDQIGEESLNKRLAEERAISTATQLQEFQSETRGVGEQLEFYDNSRPEGRMYSRTVKITAKTPIE